MTTDARALSTLRRGIGGPLLFAFILGDVLGAGIYALMGGERGRRERAGPPRAFPGRVGYGYRPDAPLS